MQKKKKKKIPIDTVGIIYEKKNDDKCFSIRHVGRNMYRAYLHRMYYDENSSALRLFKIHDVIIAKALMNRVIFIFA